MSTSPLLYRQISLTTLQSLNFYDTTGIFQRFNGNTWQSAFVKMYACRQALKALDARQELVIRMIAEGFNQDEIALELGACRRTVSTITKQLRWLMYGDLMRIEGKKDAIGLWNGVRCSPHEGSRLQK